MPEPESYRPEGGHMGITMGFHEDARRTEVDLEDTGAALSQAQVRVQKLSEAAKFAIEAIRYAREPHHLDHAEECSLCHVAADQLDAAAARLQKEDGPLINATGAPK